MNGRVRVPRKSGRAKIAPDKGSWNPTRYKLPREACSDEEAQLEIAKQSAVTPPVRKKKGRNWSKRFPGNWHMARTKRVIHID
jgi:hypothetical protein